MTGGILRGRFIRVPDRAVRPTQDRVREALFSTLAGRVAGARVLDLFAGSGALGLEAWSRGAAYVCWVEQDPAVFRALKRNVDRLCGKSEHEIRCVRKEVFRYLRRVKDEPTYDLVLADPPYAAARQDRFLENILRLLHQRTILKPGGLFVFEQAAEGPEVDVVGWRLLKAKRYGETLLSLYTRDATPSGDSIL